MAILGKGILDGFKGKMDGLVGQRRNGHSTIAQHRDGSDINWSIETDAERTRMSFLCAVFRTLPVALYKQIYCEGPARTTHAFRMIKANYSNATASSYTPTSSFVGYHTMEVPIIGTTLGRLSANGALTVLWNAVLLRRHEHPSDVAICLVYFPHNHSFVVPSIVRVRSQQAIATALSAQPNGRVYFIIFMFRSADGRIVSGARVHRGVVGVN